MTNEEREGIGMMQTILAVIGVTEPEEVSLRIWREYNEPEKELTRRIFYDLHDASNNSQWTDDIRNHLQ